MKMPSLLEINFTTVFLFFSDPSHLKRPLELLLGLTQTHPKQDVFLSYPSKKSATEMSLECGPKMGCPLPNSKRGPNFKYQDIQKDSNANKIWIRIQMHFIYIPLYVHVFRLLKELMCLSNK